MSTPKNNKIRAVAPKSVFESAKNGITTSTNYNQGDLLHYNSSTKVIEKLSAESDASTFLGVALTTVVNGVNKGPYTGLSDLPTPAVTDVPGPEYGSIFSFTLKTGDSLSFGSDVYADPADGDQYVQASGTKSIGTYQGPAVTGASSGTLVECLIGTRYPNDTLKF